MNTFDHVALKEANNMRAEVEGRLLCLADLDMRPDRLGQFLLTHGLDRLWSSLMAGRDPGAMGSDGSEPTAVPADRLRAWQHQLLRLRPDVMAEQHARAGLRVFGVGQTGYPEQLACRSRPSGVIIVKGDVETLYSERSVAIVGTRRATTYGRQMAKKLGHDLADAGINVVSGLAKGIDGAAHEGVVARRSGEPEQFSSSATGQLFNPVAVGSPIGVIAHGHDYVYPAIHRPLFREVVRHGVLVSEHPIGNKPFAHYFPQRNAVVAGLAALVIVVESADGGGSMITARIAHGEGMDVLAVPGSVFSESSSGCNRLINDGAAICRGAQDVIDTLNGVPRHERGTTAAVVDRRRVPGPEAARVLQAMGWDVLAVETLLSRCPEFTPGRLLLILHELEFDEWVARGSDGWFQRAPK